MLDNATWLERAKNALEDLARATGIPYSPIPKLNAISLLNDHHNNVYAMLVTGIDSDRKVERGVTPYGDPPMTAREFVAAAAIAEASVYAVHHYREGGRLHLTTHATTSRTMVDISASTAEPRQKAATLLETLAAELGSPPMRIIEDDLGLLAIEQPAPIHAGPTPAESLVAALIFALNALYHHERLLSRLEHQTLTD